jgi:hypothetical protein
MFPNDFLAFFWSSLSPADAILHGKYFCAQKNLRKILGFEVLAAVVMKSSIFTRPVAACGISIGVAKEAVRDWTNRNHKKYWESTNGFKQPKGLIPGPSARRTKDLLKLNRDQLNWVVELFTGHCHLKGNLFKRGLTDDPICERCLEQDESATHTYPM